MTGDVTLGEAHMADDAGLPAAPRFAVVLRGYDRRQVDEHVERLQRVFARMRTDLDAARSQSPAAAGPVPRVAPRPRPGVPEGDQIGSFTDRMQSILAEAEAEAAEIRRNAQQAARAETEGVRAQLADLVRQRDAVLAELTRMRGQLEGMLAAPTASMPARFGPAHRPGPPPPPPGPDRLHGPAPAGPPGPLGGAPLGVPLGPVPPPVPVRAGAAPSGAVPRTPETATRSDGSPRTGSPAAPASKDGPGHALRPPGRGDGEGTALRPGADDAPRGSRPDAPAARPGGEAHETRDGRPPGRPGEHRPVPAGAHADPDDLDSRRTPDSRPAGGHRGDGEAARGAVPRSTGASTPAAKADVAGSDALVGSSAPAAAGRAPQSGADRAGSGPGASGPTAPNGSGPKPDTADRGPGREAPAGTPSSGSGSSRAGGEATPRRDPGKPAHRLPSGAYPAVPGRPPGRSAPEPAPEPAELFRAPTAAERGTPESRPGEPRAAAGPERPPERPASRGGVQPADPTVLAEVPGRPAPRTDRA